MDSLFFIDLNTDAVSRYAPENFMQYANGNHDPITSDLLMTLKNLQSGGQFTINGQESRPDQIAQAIYGDTQYWWIILVYNSITSIDQLVNGLQLGFPQVAALEDYYFSLKRQQDKITP